MRRSGPEAYFPSCELVTPWNPEFSAEDVVRVLEPWVTPERRQKVRNVVEHRLGSVTLVLDAPYDPHNGSAVLRSCDAFGVQTVHVLERSERFMLARRAARGSERWVDVVTYKETQTLVSSLESGRYTLVATHPEGECEPHELRNIERLALILGNEHRGIHDDLLERAERTVRVPMRGFVESLNLSVTAAVLLSAATQGRPGDFNSASLTQLYARGLFRSVERAADVLAASRANGK